MTLLAIDTCASLCSAALYDCHEDRLLASRSDNIGRGHAEHLMDLLAGLLKDARLRYKDIDRIAATIGPGSFTGIRIALATARGLGLALKAPVDGVGVLEAIAFEHCRHNNADKRPLVVALDARRDEIYWQMFDPAGKALDKPGLRALETIAGGLPQGAIRMAGSASDHVVEACGGREIEVISRQHAADIDAVAALAARIRPGSSDPSPLYLRRADAKPQSGFAVPQLSPLPGTV